MASTPPIALETIGLATNVEVETVLDEPPPPPPGKMTCVGVGASAAIAGDGGAERPSCAPHSPISTPPHHTTTMRWSPAARASSPSPPVRRAAGAIPLALAIAPEPPAVAIDVVVEAGLAEPLPAELACVGPAGASVAAADHCSAERPSSSRFSRICVYCGSAKGKKASYQDAAVELGKELVEKGINLVYGGGSIGLMGMVSHAVHAGGRHVIGIIPKSLMPREVTGDPVGEVRAVSGMHERKAEMARFADAFIALPGGYGTLEELLEVITWAQLGIHKKPVGLLNVDGFYDPLLLFIDLAVNEGFITEDARRIIISAPTAKELVMKLEDYVPEYDIGLIWEEQLKQNNNVPVPELETGITSSGS